MNTKYNIIVKILAFIALVGGINWLVTAINSWSNDSEPTYDLLQKNLNIPVDVSNVIYILVFICTLVLYLMILFPSFNKKIV